MAAEQAGVLSCFLESFKAGVVVGQHVLVCTHESVADRTRHRGSKAEGAQVQCFQSRVAKVRAESEVTSSGNAAPCERHYR